MVQVFISTYLAENWDTAQNFLSKSLFFTHFELRKGLKCGLIVCFISWYVCLNQLRVFLSVERKTEPVRIIPLNGGNLASCH